MADRKIKPNDGVEVKWLNSKFHTKGATSIVHKENAAKLVRDGKAELVKGGKTTQKEVGEGGDNV